MDEYYQLEPEVAGEVGPGSVVDRHEHPPKVEYLDYIFNGWLGDCLVESFPVFMITEMAANELLENKLTGFELKEASVSIDPSFADLYPDSDTPDFKWLAVNGKAFSTDFGLKDNMLIASKEALLIIQKHGLKHCDIVKFRKKQS